MIAITYVANPFITEREAILTLSATDAGATESMFLSLSYQSGARAHAFGR